MRRSLIVAMVVIIACLVSLFFYERVESTQVAAAQTGAAADALQSTSATAVDFYCSENKTITATFYQGASERVGLALSDGRTVALPRGLSGVGSRYVNDDESFVFWNKGDAAFITEGDSGNVTYSNCNLKE